MLIIATERRKLLPEAVEECASGIGQLYISVKFKSIFLPIPTDFHLEIPSELSAISSITTMFYMLCNSIIVLQIKFKTVLFQQIICSSF